MIRQVTSSAVTTERAGGQSRARCQPHWLWTCQWLLLTTSALLVFTKTFTPIPRKPSQSRSVRDLEPHLRMTAGNNRGNVLQAAAVALLTVTWTALHSLRVARLVGFYLYALAEPGMPTAARGHADRMEDPPPDSGWPLRSAAATNAAAGGMPMASKSGSLPTNGASWLHTVSDRHETICYVAFCYHTPITCGRLRK